jgi:hypothetical protein
LILHEQLAGSFITFKATLAGRLFWRGTMLRLCHGLIVILFIGFWGQKKGMSKCYKRMEKYLRQFYTLSILQTSIYSSV